MEGVAVISGVVTRPVVVGVGAMIEAPEAPEAAEAVPLLDVETEDAPEDAAELA